MNRESGPFSFANATISLLSIYWLLMDLAAHSETLNGIMIGHQTVFWMGFILNDLVYVLVCVHSFTIFFIHEPFFVNVQTICI